MLNRYSILLAFVLATLLAAGGVELFYRSLSQTLKENSGTAQAKTAKAAAVKENSDNAPALRQAKKTAAPEKTDSYAIITRRNLFGKVAEKNSEKIPETEPVLTATSLDLRLLGTIGGETGDQRAFIHNKKDNSQDIYYTGDAIEHALIKEIGRGKIILTVDGKDEILLMEESKSPKGSAKTPDNNSEIYSLADAMEREKKSKPPVRQNTSRQKRLPRKAKPLKLERPQDN